MLGKEQKEFLNEASKYFKKKDVDLFTPMFYTLHNFVENKPGSYGINVPTSMRFYDNAALERLSSWILEKEEFNGQEIMAISQLISYLYADQESGETNILVETLNGKLDVLKQIGDNISAAPESDHKKGLLSYFAKIWAHALESYPEMLMPYQQFTETTLFNSVVIKDQSLDKERFSVAKKGYISEKKKISWLQLKLISRNKEFIYRSVNDVINEPHLHNALVEIVNKHHNSLLSEVKGKTYFHVEIWALLYQVRNDIRSDVRSEIEFALQHSTIEQQHFCEQWFAAKPDIAKQKVLTYITTRGTLAYAMGIAKTTDGLNILNQFPENRWFANDLNNGRTSYIQNPEFAKWLLDPKRSRDTTSQGDSSNRGLQHLLQLFPERKHQIMDMLRNTKDYYTNLGEKQWNTIKSWLQQDILGLPPEEDLDVMLTMGRDLMNIQDPVDLGNYALKHLIQRVGITRHEEIHSMDIPNDSWIP